ncbi:helix-turn-helix domain-containing protein [Anabaena cylindrica FACHB-243]|uniref:Uncharacterized protein n=1 Tax=Anabaena cylindrica (strain ATCC 27899 / PCC 7122) TaxID=272123 RepID=K9ZSS7_ANACC|nr:MULTISPECIES: helix-turn-helix domain-containing protein [Anabaena]AFZ61430.1 hypothetical protein Anacy_6161 [Anabaena cylindrica PCC 7122]MBD2421554.1 helix-turn-helix domain-containing protein [Anabaena cylindrica FACHB-243]MBY5284253.1 helix-turn-helix domain-containing protein [Anabaena sp. CCAP 1446/1C]MBY5310624.1 helix-turn-helix domain-containing protein [Anabaena sp. CCAP 1446/1C]MCM2405969.1 helix-turn-helix domain-containing protein [Anabaena sp. CCAP 1446/1C]
MANKEDKLRIFELLKKGIKIGEIEKTSKIPRRTLYRWYKDYQDSLILNPIKDAVQEVKIEVESELSDIDFSQDWIKIISKNSITGCLVNTKIREKLSNLLLNQLEEEKDLNFRAIAALSSSINVHSKLEREYGFYYLLDPNIAIKSVESKGYVIDNPAEPKEIENVDLSGMTAEELAREYKKLLAAS